MSVNVPVLLLDLDGVLNPRRGAPTLLVAIDPAVGWTRADVDRVLA